MIVVGTKLTAHDQTKTPLLLLLNAYNKYVFITHVYGNGSSRVIVVWSTQGRSEERWCIACR